VEYETSWKKVRQSDDSELVVFAMHLPETTLAASEAGPQHLVFLLTVLQETPKPKE